MMRARANGCERRLGDGNNREGDLMRVSGFSGMDLNADLGEGCEGDAALMLLIQRANIACGGHAGDHESMRVAIQSALQHGVAIGAHPSYPDRENFGRVETGASATEIERFCAEQLTEFAAVARECGANIAHVKPHGALYHRVMQDADAARALLRAVKSTIGNCAIMGLPDSVLQREVITAGLPYLAEMFADRRYEEDGSLAPRQHPEALIHSIDEALAQVESVCKTGTLRTRTGKTLSLHANTVCVHGDGEHALMLAKALREALQP